MKEIDTRFESGFKDHFTNKQNICKIRENLKRGTHDCSNSDNQLNSQVGWAVTLGLSTSKHSSPKWRETLNSR